MSLEILLQIANILNKVHNSNLQVEDGKLVFNYKSLTTICMNMPHLKDSLLLLTKINQTSVDNQQHYPILVKNLMEHNVSVDNKGSVFFIKTHDKTIWMQQKIHVETFEEDTFLKTFEEFINIGLLWSSSITDNHPISMSSSQFLI